MKDILLLIGLLVFWIWILGSVENFVVMIITTLGVIGVMALIFLPICAAGNDHPKK